MKILGFTLTELLIVLAIAASILVFAIPTSQKLIIENQMTSDVNSLLGALYRARSEAIQRGTVVTFCGSRDKKQCADDWKSGQIILDAQGKLLQVLTSFSAGAELSWRSSYGRNEFLKFLPTGFAAQQGSFYYSLARGNKTYSRRIVINYAGRIWVSNN